MEYKKLPIGIDRFKKLREEDFYYVDKTGMIKDLLNTWGEVNLFTRPRRFGKSLNMDMLKAFFEIGTDKTLFEGLAISDEKKLCDKHMGKYPVISLSLKDVDGFTYESAVKKMGGVIRKEARRLQFLLESDRLSDYDKSYMHSLMQFDLDAELQEESIAVLSELLYKHYGEKVIILIDEYDVPLDKAYSNGYYDEMVMHIRNIFGSALKTNESLFFAVVTGCLRIARESIFTGLNNFKVNTISDTRFSSHFGFTDAEVRGMLNYYDLEEFYVTIKEWYDGYHFGQKEIYCPWDVINYCDKLLESRENEPQLYWANSSSNYIIQKILSQATETTKSQIEMLISGETVEKKLLPELTYTDLKDEDATVRETYLWSVMFATGYLTDVSRAEDGIHRLAIPNREIREIYIDKIRSWYNAKIQKDTNMWHDFCNAVKSGDAQKFQELFNSYMSRSISIRDTCSRKEMKENFYHGMLLGILQCESRWIVKSNQESGVGYGDIILQIPEENIGCVIELKYAENGSFDTSCKEALSQIEKNDYAAVLRDEGIGTIYVYGVACYKKTCRIMARIVPCPE